MWEIELFVSNKRESYVHIEFSTLLLVRSDEDQAAELSRLLDQKAYLEELTRN